MLDQPVPNPVAKNPNIYTHKVFASVGLILFGTIVILSVLAYFYRDQVADFFNTAKDNSAEITKVSTSSAKTDAENQTSNETTSDQSTEWKTFSSSELGFSIKYPPTWVQKGPGEGGANDKNVNFYSPDYISSNNFGYLEDGSFIYVNSGSMYSGVNTIDDWVEDTGYQISNRQNITVDGIEAAKFDYVNNHGAKYDLVVIIKTSKITELWVTTSKEESDINSSQEIFDQMVESFKFL